MLNNVSSSTILLYVFKTWSGVFELADFLQFNLFYIIFLIGMSKKFSFLTTQYYSFFSTCGQDTHRNSQMFKPERPIWGMWFAITCNRSNATYFSHSCVKFSSWLNYAVSFRQTPTLDLQALCQRGVITYLLNLFQWLITITVNILSLTISFNLAA